MYSAIAASKRKKHSPLNSYISLYETGEDQSSLIDTMEADGQSNPEELMVSREYVATLESKLEESLSDLENRGAVSASAGDRLQDHCETFGTKVPKQ